MLEINEGWTDDLDFQLTANGVAVNLTGMTVTLELKGNDDVAVDTAGDVTVFDAADGKVRYNPDGADLVNAKNPYRAHWKVDDGGGKIAFFPSGKPDLWIVHKV